MKIYWLNSLSTSKRFGLKLSIVFTLGILAQFFLAQKGDGLFLSLGLGLFALAVIFLFRFVPVENPTAHLSPENLSPQAEVIIFLLILTLGIFLRTSGINQFPQGIFVDRAEVACGALRILYDHWRPFTDALNLHVPELCIYYMVAAWFKLFGSSPEAFAYFDVFLSTAGIVLIYVTFRQLIDPLPSLLAFFLLSVMRWNFVFAHQNYFQSQTVFFTGLTLAPLFYALRVHKPVYAAIAGLVLGIGIYSYQSFKAVPLLVAVFMVFELFQERSRWKENKKTWIVLWGVFILAVVPYLMWTLANGELGRRESEVSILGNIHSQNSLLPLWENFRDFALLFNHRGADWNNQSNFQYHRVLDDITAIFFVLGFFYALQRIKERPFFIAVAGLGVMSLPGIFSNCGASLGRMLGATPFVALLCALFLTDLWNRYKTTQPSTRFKYTTLSLCLLLFAGAAFENYYTYFFIQTKVPECINDCSWPESQAGRFILVLPSNTECFLPSMFYGHPTVQYLAYSKSYRMHLLDLSHPPNPSSFPKGSNFCFLLDAFKTGTLDFLKTLYPGGKPEAFLDPLGNIPLYTYQVPTSVLEKFANKQVLKKGLEGFYRHTSNEKESPFLTRWDPILNFTFRDLPMIGTPLFIHWAGNFTTAKAGIYRLGVVIFNTTRGRITVDRKGNSGFTNQPFWEGALNPGFHQLDFFYEDSGSQVAQVNLLWIQPGQNKFEFMPNNVFGKIHQ